MKSVISALLIFIFIIITSFSSSIYINRISDEILQSLYKNEIYVAKNLWQDAEIETEKLCSLWKKSRSIMSISFNHTLIDRVDTSIAKIKNTVQMQKKEDFFYESSTFDLLIANLKEQQKISIGNIF